MGAIFPKLTDLGRALSAKIEQGNGTIPLNITRITAGAGQSSDPLSQTAVIDERQEWTVTAKAAQGAMTRITAHLTNVPSPELPGGLTVGYDVWQVGFYATDPDLGEILYRIMPYETPLHMPPYTETPRTYKSDFTFTTHNASDVIINVNPAGLATIEYVDNADAKRVPLANGQAVADGLTMETWRQRELDVIVFTGVQNEKSDIILPDGIFNGWIELTLTAPGHSAGIGRLTKRFSIYTANSATVNSQETKYTDVDSAIGTQLAISDIKVKNGKRVITVSRLLFSYNLNIIPNITIVGNTGLDITAISLSNIYTTDPTVFPAPVVWNNIQSGKFTPRIYGGTVNGTPKYTSYGKWQKIGKLNNIKGRVNITNLGGMSGTVFFADTPLALPVGATMPIMGNVILSGANSIDKAVYNQLIPATAQASIFEFVWLNSSTGQVLDFKAEQITGGSIVIDFSFDWLED